MKKLLLSMSLLFTVACNTAPVDKDGNPTTCIDGKDYLVEEMQSSYIKGSKESGYDNKLYTNAAGGESFSAELLAKITLTGNIPNTHCWTCSIRSDCNNQNYSIDNTTVVIRNVTYYCMPYVSKICPAEYQDGTHNITLRNTLE
jgi:hypothetical protein